MVNMIAKHPSILDLRNQITSIVKKPSPTRIYFQGSSCVLSNMYPCEIRYGNRVFSSTETFYQWRKATEIHASPRLLRDLECAKDSFEANRLSKHLDRVQSFEWSMVHGMDVMREVIELKYNQVPEFKDLIDNSGDAILLEATHDPYWGIGCSHEEADAVPVENLPGRNLLGELLMGFRETVGMKAKLSAPSTISKASVEMSVETTATIKPKVTKLSREQLPVVDTHFHMGALLSNGFSTLTEAINADDYKSDKMMLTACVANYCYPEQWKAVDALPQDEWVYNSFGVHPSRASDYLLPRAIDHLCVRFREILKTPRCIAIAECGLDYHRALATQARDAQKLIFRHLVTVFKEVRLPLIIHCREPNGAFHELALKDLLDILLKECFPHNRKIIVHCFLHGWACY